VSLRADALYCAVCAVVVAAVGGPLSSAVGVSGWVLRGAAGMVAVWAALLFLLSDGRRLDQSLRFVGGVNAAAAVAVGVAAWNVPSVWLAVLLAAVTVEVGGFACSQAVALRRLCDV